MWFLTSEVDTRVIYVLDSREITIGRRTDAQVCDFAIIDDPSISRKHATLSASNNFLFLQDLGSRYGTYVNDAEEKLEPNSKIKLNTNDVIRFGKMGSVWKVRNISFITCTSTLKGENLQNLRLCLEKCGGMLKNEWDDSCAYLTMPALTLTIKVVLALAQGSFIVTTEFWQKCLEAITNKFALPDPANFIPKVIESTLNKENVSFQPIHDRKSLFAGKTVVFFGRRQLETYKMILMKCSAVPVLLSETKMTKSSLCESNVIVIQYNPNHIYQETQGHKNQIDDFASYFKSKGKRMVAEAEIGLAILYCSTTRYCNPDFDFSAEIVKQAPGPVEKPNIVLAKESQDNVQQKRENVVVNESLNSTCNISESGESSKRKLSEEDSVIGNNVAKKFAKSDYDLLSKENLKRKFTDDSNEQLSPNKKLAVNDEDLFNFTSKNKNEVVQAGKTLNLSLPQNRNMEVTDNDEEDLFKFIEDKSNSKKGEGNKIFEIKTKSDIKQELETELSKQPRVDSESKLDIETLRGSKLKELHDMRNDSNVDHINISKIKKESMDDIDKKFQDLELGTIIITIRKDLIKREPLNYSPEFNRTVTNGVKNYKKFKKVWPIRKHSIAIPKSTKSVVIPESLQEMDSQVY